MIRSVFLNRDYVAISYYKLPCVWPYDGQPSNKHWMLDTLYFSYFEAQVSNAVWNFPKKCHLNKGNLNEKVSFKFKMCCLTWGWSCLVPQYTPWKKNILCCVVTKLVLFEAFYFLIAFFISKLNYFNCFC